MLDLRHLTRLITLAAACGLIVAACGSSAASPSAAPSSELSAAPSIEAPSEAPSEEAASEAPAASEAAAALPSFDLGALSGAIPGLDSYRTSTSMGGVKQYESVVVTQPVLSKAITVYDDTGKVSNRYVIIGKEAWQADGPDGRFQSVPPELASSMLLAFDPALMLGAYASVDWSQAATDQGTEAKNGVEAHHVRIDSTSLLGVAGAMPAGAAIDIWVANAGYLVAWEMSGFTPAEANFSIQVTGVNDSANKVERPS